MKKYVVGGYVRDRYMGLTPHDKDYVLVNCNQSDIKYLMSIGYEQVGKDFPVFLSPEGDEYALARTERKVGFGYAGFEVNTKNVTLEEDLSRRDLTINAIAFDGRNKTHIDPFGGLSDIDNKILRHVSEAFKEDPLRVLRLARFKARFPDFSIHGDTDKMVRQMVKDGELDHLTKERVFVEFEKAMTEEKPSEFFKYLNDIGALKILLPSTKLSKADYTMIDNYRNNASDKSTKLFIWKKVLDNVSSIDKSNYSTEKLTLTKDIFKFIDFVSNNIDEIKNIQKIDAEELCTLYDKLNLKNKGSDEFIYQLCEYLRIENGAHDFIFEEYFIKTFDVYQNTEIPDIDQMIKDKFITVGEIKGFIHDLRLKNLSEFLS